MLPAIAMAVSLGVTLPTPARAQTTINSGNATVSLAGYGGPTSFDVPLANTVNAAAGVAVYGDNSQSWTLTNEGTLRSNTGPSSAIYFRAGGSVGNSGLISDVAANSSGVYISGSSGAVTNNNGTIIGSGTGGIGVLLGAGGVVTNTAGLISGDAAGLRVNGADGTVTNGGTITGTGGSGLGIYFNNGSNNTLINSGAIIGNGGTAVLFGGGDDLLQINSGASFTGVVDGGAGTDQAEFVSGNVSVGFANFETAQIDTGATWTNTGGFDGQVLLANGASLDNQGNIVGTLGNTVYGDSAGTVTNSGTIQNNASSNSGGVILMRGGEVTNTGTGSVIEGDFHGVYLGQSLGSGGTVTNYGAITATGSSGIGLSIGGAAYASTGTVQNHGQITATGTNSYGVSLGLFTSGTVTNYYGGLISGTKGGVVGATFARTDVTNFGTIQGGYGDGVRLSVGNVSNKAGGYIAGANGVRIGSSTAILYNAGTIYGSTRYGAYMSSGGVITNSGTASSITGYLYGVVIGASASINNQGTISGGAGIKFGDGANSTLVNSGSIIATYGSNSNAVVFGNGNDLLQIGNGAYFGGAVDGGAGTNTLELVGSGTLSGNALFENFQGVTIGGSQDWHFGGTLAFNENITVANAGTLRVDGGLYINGATLSNSGTIFTNGGSSFSGAISLYGGALVNNNYLSNSGAIYNEGTSSLTNNGTFINSGYISSCDCSTFTNAGSLLNTADGYIVGGTGGGSAIIATGTSSTITNYGIIVGYSGIYGDSSAKAVIDNHGIIASGFASSGYGINLQGDGNVTNGGSFSSFLGSLATIYGHRTGVQIAGHGTITNNGYIFSYTDPAVILGTGVITNGDTSNRYARISSYTHNGVQLGSGTVTNYGTIGSYGTSPSTAGIRIQGAGTITNRGEIYGVNGILASGTIGDIATIVNSGYIHSTATAGIGIYIASASVQGVIVNYAGGTIAGGIGVEARNTSLTNSGTISGNTTGVVLEGTLTNNAGGTIYGGQRGIYLDRNGSNVTNSGLIQGGSGAGIEVDNLSGYLNTTITNAGTIIGGGGIAVAFGRGSDTMQIGAGSSITGSVDGGIGQDTLEFIAGANSSFANFTNFETLTVDSGATWTNIGGLTVPTVTDAGLLINANHIQTTVTLTGAGTLTNAAGAIDGASTAIYGHNSTGAGVLINNAAAISGSYAGIFLVDGGRITNTGTAAYIYGGDMGVYARGTATITNQDGFIQGGSTGLNLVGGGAVTNGGVIGSTASYTNGIFAAASLTLVNNAGGTIQGGNRAIYLGGSYNSITNDGLIRGSGSDGVFLRGGGNNVTNTGTISGVTGVRFFGYGGLGSTLTNGGVITGTGGTAVQMGSADDVLRVLPGAAFQGAVDGGAGSNTLAFIGTGGTLSGTAAFTRFGTILFDANSSWTFAGSQSFGYGVTLRNVGTLTNAGTLDLLNAAYRGLVNIGTFINQGTLTGTIFDTGVARNSGRVDGGVVLYSGGVLDNQAGGTIDGEVYGYRSGISISNAGTITTTSGDAVRIAHGGSFTNSGTASLVTGANYGLRTLGVATYVTNQGTISGSTRGVLMSASGTFTNSGTASLVSGANGGIEVNSYGGNGVITNQGTITSANSSGVWLRGDGTVNNSGSIGGTIGVLLSGGTSATLINSGTISGSGYNPTAVQFFGSGDSTLVVMPGAAFNGVVVGSGGSHNSLVFAGSGGTLTGNANFYSFQNATIANGASWTFAGTGTFNYGVTLSNAGSLTNTGTLHFPDSRVPFFNSGTFQNNGYFQGGIADYGLVRNSGSIYGGIGLLAGGTLDNQAGGVITASEVFAIAGRANGVSLNNTGTIEGGHFSAYFDASAAVSNSGLISGDQAAVYFTYNGAGTVSNSGTLTGSYEGAFLRGGGTITNQGLITASGQHGTGIYLIGGGSITNSGTISAPASGIAIHLENAAHVTNSGLVTGEQYGIFAYEPGSVISNSGTISGTGTYSAGIGFGSGSISNTGASSVISGARYGIMAFGGGGLATTITNQGTISGATSAGILLRGDGVITNSAGAAITGYSTGIDAYSGTTTITNSGTIIATGTSSRAINLDHGAVINSGTASLIQGGARVGYYSVVTNQGTIIGGASSSAISADYGSTVTNSGLVLTAATTGNGIYLYGSGLITNSGTVRATGDRGAGIYLYGYGGSTGVFSNTGLIRASGTYGIGVYAFGGSISNSGTIQADGTYGTGIRIARDASLVNTGAVLAPGSSGVGIYMYDGGSVSNSGVASRIAGGYAGILVYGDGASITNQGTVSGQLGVGLNGASNTLTNSGTASLITGSHIGVLSYGDRNLITNQGTISGAIGVGIGPGATNTLSNSGTASSITGSYRGVLSYGSGTRITNQGTISGVIGVEFRGTAGDTLSNSGTIIGTGGTAVQFGSGDDLLIIQPGAVFTGVADGGAGANTLEFAGGNQIPDFTKFTHFGGAMLDAGTTWTFNTAQTFPAGLTLVNAGTLINNSTLTNNGLITNNGVFTNNGTVNGGLIGNTGSLGNSGLIAGGTYGVTGGGTISNSGTITGTNTGVVLTNGSLNNTGLIQGGTYGVQLGAGATLSNSGIIKDDAIAGASLGTNSSFINNAGSTLFGVTGVVFTGTGASLTNNGTITGSGGIAIQFGAGVNTVTLGTTSVLNGTINGGGGAGRIVLNGAGSLGNAVSNFGTGSSLTVASGASWSVGNLAIGTVTNNGTLSLGATPATVTLNGNFTQSSTGVLNAVLDNGGGSSRILVTGTAALDGTLHVVMPTVVGAPIKYTLISATGGVTGAFSNLNADTVLLSSVLSYDANDAYVTVAQRKLSAPAGVTETTNQFAVASGFDAGVQTDPMGFGPVLGAFNALNAAGFITTLNQMSGEQLVDVSTTALLAGRQFLGQIQQHTRLSAQAPGTWSLWGQGFGQSGSLDGNGNAHDLNQGLSGVMVGADVGIAPSFRLGGVVGFASGHFNVVGDLGGGRMDYTQVALTGSYGAGAFYVDGTLGGVFGAGTSRRDVTVGTTVNHATAHLDTTEVIGAFEAGYRMSLDESVSLTPFARIQTGSVGREALAESGAGILNLAAPHWDSVATESILGARLGAGLPLGDLMLGVDASIGWSHELAGAARMARLSFAGTAGTDFIMTGASLSRDGADIGLGFSVPVFGTGQASLHYDGNYGGNGTSHAVGLGLRFGW